MFLSTEIFSKKAKDLFVDWRETSVEGDDPDSSTRRCKFVGFLATASVDTLTKSSVRPFAYLLWPLAALDTLPWRGLCLPARMFIYLFVWDDLLHKPTKPINLTICCFSGLKNEFLHLGN